MDKLLYRKINLLVHLAHVDGKFDAAEKDFLHSILEEKGLHAAYLEQHVAQGVNLKDLSEIPGKTELLYWVLKLIHADGQLHQAELSYAKVVARQLGFKEVVIDRYKTKPVKTLVDFEKDVKTFQER